MAIAQRGVDARRVLEEWVEMQLLDTDTVAAKTLATEAMVLFGRDPEWVQAIAEQGLPGIVHDAILRAIGTGRAKHLAVSPSGAVTPNRERILAGNVALVPSFAKWFEYLPDKTHKRLTAMTRGELRLAADVRRARGAGEFARAQLFGQMADLMPNDTVTVGEAFTAAQIKTFEESLSPLEAQIYANA